MQCGLDVAYEMVVTTSAARGGVNAESKIPSENAQRKSPRWSSGDPGLVYPVWRRRWHTPQLFACVQGAALH
jgi:hypothetical protein